MGKGLKQGENVSIEFVSADATTAALVTLKDANLNTRVLKSYERLVLDSINAQVASAANPADLFADINGNGTVDANELLMSTTAVDFQWQTEGEGMNVPTGITPKVKAAAAGVIKITGTGRIIKAKTEGVRPSWQQTLNP